MISLNVDINLAQDILDYFKSHHKNSLINESTKLIDLGLESIDYIEMAEIFFKKTGKWLDITQINDNTKLLDIPSCLINPVINVPDYGEMVKLCPTQRRVYAHELNATVHLLNICHINSFCLADNIDIPRLEDAIYKTLESHFILNSKLALIDNDYFFVRTLRQSNIKLKRSFLFPKRAYAQLVTTVHSDRLVRLFIQKKNKHHYLIMAYHHIALDGWSSMMVREEIFRRYEGRHVTTYRDKAEEIKSLNKTSHTWISDGHNSDELASKLLSINHAEYNQLDVLFHGEVQIQFSCFVIEKEYVDQYALNNEIQGFPYSVIFALLCYQSISYLSGVNKLFFYTSLSNRYLPILRIKELLTNMATALPLYLDNTNLSSKQFAEKINKDLTLCSRQMSYGALQQLWGKEPTLRDKMSPRQQRYSLLYTYINKITDDKDYSQNHYINWSKSRCEIFPGNRKTVFFRVYNMGSKFIINIDSQMIKGFHRAMVSDFFKSRFPRTIK